NLLAVMQTGALRGDDKQRRPRIVAGQHGLEFAGLNGNRNPAVEIGEQDHPGRVVPRDENSPDHSSVIDNRLAWLDVLVAAGVNDHGVEKRPAGTADDVSRDARDFRIRNGVEKKLIAPQPLLERK